MGFPYDYKEVFRKIWPPERTAHRFRRLSPPAGRDGRDAPQRILLRRFQAAAFMLRRFGRDHFISDLYRSTSAYAAVPMTSNRQLSMPLRLDGGALALPVQDKGEHKIRTFCQTMATHLSTSTHTLGRFEIRDHDSIEGSRKAPVPLSMRLKGLPHADLMRFLCHCRCHAHWILLNLVWFNLNPGAHEFRARH